jgi:hypothetical protein
MVNRNERTPIREIDKLNESDRAAVVSYISEQLPPKKKHSQENPINDELIVTLADALENRRAQQVTEWEQMRRQTMHQTA